MGIRRPTIVAAAATIVLAACGGDEAVHPGSSIAVSSTTVTTTPVDVPATEEPAPVDAPIDSVSAERPVADLADELEAEQPLLLFSDETYRAGAPIVAPFLGLPLGEFTDEVLALGLGPVRIVEGDGMTGEPTADLVPGRVDVETEERDGLLIVLDAAVETDMGAAPDFVGAPLEDLLDEADDGPWPRPIRVVERDGERLPIDDGFDPRRVNIVVESGIVVAIESVG